VLKNALGDAALARHSISAHGTWELSHDSIRGGAVVRFLGRSRPRFVRNSARYAAPTLLATTVLLVQISLYTAEGGGPKSAKVDRELGLSIKLELHGNGLDDRAQLQKFRSITSLRSLACSSRD